MQSQYIGRGDIHISHDDLSQSPKGNFVRFVVGKVHREGDVVVRWAISMDIGPDGALWDDSRGRSVLGAALRHDDTSRETILWGSGATSRG